MEKFSPNTNILRFAERLAQLRMDLSLRDPLHLAMNTGSSYQHAQAKGSGFLFNYWGRPVFLSYPDFVASDQGFEGEMPALHQAVLLYYFHSADGAPLQGNWISFSELPHGKFYNQAFQGYTGGELVRKLGNNQQGFERAARALHGEPSGFGSSSFAFQVLPRVPLLVVFWQGDDEFAPSFQLLFDASASHYLPTDGYAILGSNLVHKLTNQ